MRGVVEKPTPETAPSSLSVIGRYILPHSVMQLLADLPPGAGNEIQLTDAIDRYLKDGGSVEAYRMHGRSFDCGNLKGWNAANAQLASEAGLLTALS